MALIVASGYVVTVHPRPVLYNHFLLGVCTILLVISAVLTVYLHRDCILRPQARDAAASRDTQPVRAARAPLSPPLREVHRSRATYRHGSTHCRTRGMLTSA